MQAIILIVSACFFLGALGAFLVNRFYIALVDVPNERSSHTFPTPRGGGIGVWVAFLFIGIFISKDIFPILISGAVGLLSFIDDRFALSLTFRLLIQLLLSTLVVWLLSGLPHSIAEVLLFLFWIVFIAGTANIYNFMDGINGIAGLTGVVSFGLMAFFSFFVIKDFEVNLLSIALVAGCLGFLPFNFPRARVFMGDVGSIFLGFVFASFVVKLSSNISIFLCLVMFLCTFYADALVTIYYRWRRGENLVRAHRSHMYQYLSNELGYAHWKVSPIYALAQFLFGTLALYAYTKGLIWQFELLGVFGIVFVTTYKIVRAIKSVRIL